MIQSNSEKLVKNSCVSVVTQIVSLLLQFINRRAFIYFLDINYLGYQNLFSNIFGFLSVAELGIGGIISFHLYKELASDNKNEIGKLMYLYKKVYQFVAFIILILGIICIVFIPYIIKNNVLSFHCLLLIYSLQLLGIVISYFFSYRRTIYIVSQQEYKCEEIDLYVLIIIQILQLAVLSLLRNYYIYLFLQILIPIISSIIIINKTNTDFKYLNDRYYIDYKYIKDKNLISDILNFLIHKISYVIYGCTDNIIISMFLGIHDVALYGNYILVQKGVMAVLFYKLLNPVQATIGNIIYSNRTKDDLWEQFKMLDVFSFYFATYIALGFFIFYQPFIELWLGKEFLLSYNFVVLFSVTMYFGAVWEIVYKYRSSFGDYKKDRLYMMLGAIFNIIISIFGAKHYGIVGIQFGTLVAFFFIAYGRIRFVVKSFFNKSVIKYLSFHALLFFVFILECAILYLITKNIRVDYFGMIIRGIYWLLVPTIVNTLVFYKYKYFKSFIIYLKQVFNIILLKLKTKF